MAYKEVGAFLIPRASCQPSAKLLLFLMSQLLVQNGTFIFMRVSLLQENISQSMTIVINPSSLTAYLLEYIGV